MTSNRQHTTDLGPVEPGPMPDVASARGRRIVGAPKYQQLADVLSEQIADGTLPPGSLMPSDAEIVGTYGVSPTTARHAIRALRDAGLIITYHGRGSFVRRRDGRPAHTIHRGVTITAGHHGASNPAAGDGEWSLVEAPGTYRIEADADLALTLGIAEHAPVFVGDRLLTTRDGRRASQRVFVPFAIASQTPALEKNAFPEPAGLYDALTDAHGRITFTDTIAARVPTGDDTATLRVPPATPLLVIRRTTHHPDGHPLTLEETRLSADDTALVYQQAPARTRRAGR